MQSFFATVEPESMKYLMVGAVAIVAIVGAYITRVVTTQAREKSRREIAAYIAEGTMTPEQGERLMRAGNPSDE